MKETRPRRGRTDHKDRVGNAGDEPRRDLKNLPDGVHKADREPGGRWGESGHDTRAADMKGLARFKSARGGSR